MCRKTYSHSRDLKRHYIMHHKKNDLKEQGIPLKALCYTKVPKERALGQAPTDTYLQAKNEEFKRTAAIDEETRRVVCDLELHVPLIKIMALAGAVQSPLPEEDCVPVTNCEHNNRFLKRY